VVEELRSIGDVELVCADRVPGSGRVVLIREEESKKKCTDSVVRS
jgi:hypothetical protein